MQMVGKKKIRQMHPVCLTRLAPTGFWRGGAAKREQGESEVIRRHSSFPLQTRGRVTVGAVFFFSQCTPRPDLHTPIGLRGARKKGGRRRSTQGNGRQPRVIWRRRRSPPEKRALHRVTTLAGGQAGGRQQNPLTTTRRRENSRAPVVFCHTVDIYSKNTLGAGLDMHPPR